MYRIYHAKLPRSGEPNRGLGNLGKTLSERKVLKAAEPPKDCRRKAEKGFNWTVRSCCLGALIRGLQNLETPCKGDVFTFFLRRAKRIKKHARGLRTSGLRGRFKALPEVIL